MEVSGATAVLTRSTPRTTMEAPVTTGFSYQPALDGVRGIAVAMVLLFHARFGWMSGGYLGVSIFFTLSGYLITSIALVEHERTGRLGVRAFYARRIRRLMPASLICLAAVMVAAWLDQFTGVTRLRRDLWAALLQIYNWAVLTGGDSYSEQIFRAAGQRAPLDHYWSLAIEEQFYWVWPIALLGILRLSSRGRIGVMVAVTSVGIVATFAISSVWGPDATYFATPARLPEILLGGLVAVVLHGRHDAQFWREFGADWIALIGIGVIGWAAVSWPAEGGPAYHGWLPMFAIASVAVIVGLQIESPLRWVMSLPPLVWLGRISYGVYLFHWPVYTIVDERTLDIGRAPLFAVRAFITLVVAAASYVVVERPIRRLRFTGWGTFGVAAATCGVAAAVVAFVPDRDGTYTFVAPETRILAGVPLYERGDDPPGLVATGQRDSAGVPVGLSRPVRVVVIGDSTAMATADGMLLWSAEHLDVLRVNMRAAPCGLTSSGLVPDDQYKEPCDSYLADIPEYVNVVQPDLVVAMVTARDMSDREWSDEEGLLPISDARSSGRLLDAYMELTRDMLDAGADHVMWVMPPRPNLPSIPGMSSYLDADNRAAYRRVLEALVSSFPGEVVVADMSTWMESADDEPDRYDGLHWSLDGAVDVAEDFMTSEVFATVLPAPSHPE